MPLVVVISSINPELALFLILNYRLLAMLKATNTNLAHGQMAHVPALHCLHQLFQLTDNIVRLSLINIDNRTIRLLVNLKLS